MQKGYVTLGVRELQDSKHFWNQGVGLPECGQWPAQLALALGELELLLDATGAIPIAPGLEMGLHRTKDQIEETLRNLSNLGFKPFRGPKDFGGPLGFEAGVRDPDGYVLVLYAGESRELLNTRPGTV